MGTVLMAFSRTTSTALAAYLMSSGIEVLNIINEEDHEEVMESEGLMYVLHA